MPEPKTKAIPPVSEQSGVISTGGDAVANLALLAGALAESSPSTVAPAENQKSSRWTPSFADLFLVALVLWTYGFGPYGWSGLLADGDAGWHIRTGETILDTGAVPRVDPYSFTKPGQPWYAWEWLSDVGMAILHRAGGLKAVVWFSGAMIAAFAGILLRYMMWKGANALMSLVVTLVAVGACSIHFLARPHLTTLVLIPITAWMIEADRRRPSARIWLLIPIFTLWTNLHGGFLAGLLLLGATAAGSIVECLAFRRIPFESIRYTSLTAACAAVTVINPYGWNLHKHVFSYLQSDWIRNAVQEFQSPSFRGESALQFEALLFLGIVCAAYLVSQGRIVETFWIAGLAHMAFGSQRHITIYSAIAAPFVAVQLTQWFSHWTSGRKKSSIPGILGQMSRDLSPAFSRNSFWVLVFLGSLLALEAPLMRWPSDFTSVMFPTELLQKHKDRIAESRTLTTDQWGDYLIYHNPARQKVFVDGRSDFFGPEIGKDYLHLLNGGHNWEQLIDKYGFNFVVAPVDWPLNSLLKRDARWLLLEDNGKALVYERRRELNATSGPKF